MEQHYILVFNVSFEPVWNNYSMGIIIKEYPGDPGKLLKNICDLVEVSSLDKFGKILYSDTIIIKSLTRTF